MKKLSNFKLLCNF